MPLLLVATLCSGMGAKSRALGHAAGLTCSAAEFQMAYIQDILDVLVWQNTEDGHKGRNQPKHRTASMIKKETSIEFDSPDDFEAFRASFFNGGE